MRCRQAILALCLMSASEVALAAPDGVRVVVDCRTDPTVALAAGEFAKYHRLLTGRAASGDRRLLLKVDGKVSPDGNDAYSIVSDPGGAVITGDKPRSVLYGVYDLLERRGGCRWFWDGDVVPKRDALDLGGLDVHEHSRFRYRATRYFSHRGLTRFRALQWGPDDWKRELDYLAKIRVNVVMFRLGWGDLFQRAFPDICPYPDPAKPRRGTGKGYDNQSLHWSLQFRGLLMRHVRSLAFARGMDVPEDFGTMTHWYTPTPIEFVEKMKPDYLMQGTSWYKDPATLVWDVTQPKWMDAYWQLTETSIREYGRSDILHTMGLSERLCSTNRAENLQIKLKIMRELLADAKRRHPESQIILGGWDFHFAWEPEVCRRLWPAIADIPDVILWDYESDATGGRGPCMSDLGAGKPSNWDVIGKFPYTFGAFTHMASSTDIRANYPVLEREWAKVKDDPFCRGYIWWPEAEHCDILFYDYFAKNSWSGGQRAEDLLPRLCEGRYGDQAEAFLKIWRKALPVMTGVGYGALFAKSAPYAVSLFNLKKPRGNIAWEEPYNSAHEIFSALAEIDWSGEFVRRDAIDIARTVADRVILGTMARLDYAIRDWRAGASNEAEIRKLSEAFATLADAMTDTLALHTDFSLWESYLRLDKVEKVRNPDFPSVLLDNASCSYCRGYQYECCAHWYKPMMHEAAKDVCALLDSGDRQAPIREDYSHDYRAKLFERGLKALRPTLPRTPENYRRVMRLFAGVLKSISPYDTRNAPWKVRSDDDVMM